MKVISKKSKDLISTNILGVFGIFMIFIGITLLFPIAVAVYYNENTWIGFLVASLFSLIPGFILFLMFRPKSEIQIREGFVLVTGTWFILSFFGAIPYYMDGTLPGFTDAFFETMSGLTTTGATILGGETHEGIINPNIEDMPYSLLFWRSITHWVGGMGFIVLSIAILPLLGTGGLQLFTNESSLQLNEKLTPRVQETAKYLWYVYLGITIVHFLMLWVHPSMNWFDAINHAFSTMATGGFSTKNNSVGAFDSAYIDYVIVLFMFLAGVNFVMHFRFIRGEFNIVRNNTELKFYTLVTIIFVTLITLGLWLKSDYHIFEALRYGSFQALAILTTTGYGTDDYLLWAPFPLALLALLFFTGASTGSTSGGIKMIRWLIILKDIKLDLKQRIHPKAVLPLRVGNTVINHSQIRNILAFFLAYLIIFALGGVYLTFLGFDMASAFGASIACLGNIGPAFGNFGPSDNFAELPNQAKWVLSVMMLVGRLELFTFLVIISPNFWKK